MQQEFFKKIYFSNRKLALKLALLSYFVFHSLAALSQEFVNPANLVFEITLATDNSIQIIPTSDSVNETTVSLLQSVARYQEAINTIQAESNSPYNFELLEQYSDLGDSHQSLGEHEEAILSFDNAIQITKIQNGLHNLDQLPLVQKIIQSYIKLGDTQNADLWHEYSYYLHLANYEATDLEMINATFALAEWNIVSFFKLNLQNPDNRLRMTNRVTSQQQRSIVGLNDPDSLAEQIAYSPGNDVMSAIFNGQIVGLNPRDVEDPLLLKVNNIYTDLQNQIYAVEQPDLTVVIQMARRIAELAYVTKQEMEFEKHNNSFNRNYTGSMQEAYRNSQIRRDRSYSSGENALQFVVSLLKTVEASPSILATSLIELADWQLAYGEISSAENTYKEVYDLMASIGTSNEVVETSLNTAIPRQIPRLATHMFSRESAGYSMDTPLDFKGYIDVSYHIDNHGNVSEINFVDSENEEAKLIQRYIINSLEVTKFRPTLDNGELTSPGRLNLRYYYSY